MLVYCRGINWAWLYIYIYIHHTGFHMLVRVYRYFVWHLQWMSFPLTDASSIINEGTSVPSSGAIIVHLYTRIGISICVYMNLFIYYLFIYLLTLEFICLFVCLFVFSLYIYIYVYVCFYVFMRLLIYLLIHLSIYLFVCLFSAYLYTGRKCVWVYVSKSVYIKSSSNSISLSN